MAGGKGRQLVGAVDQGTSSSRFLIFDSTTAELLTYHQTETQSFYPKEGWVEQDPKEILSSVLECIEKAVHNLEALNINLTDIHALGITNQRETLVVWDRTTGEPLHNAIIWLDTRTAETVENLIQKCPSGNKDYLRLTQVADIILSLLWYACFSTVHPLNPRPRCGLPISTYFTAVKMRWVLDHSEKVRQAVSQGRCCLGTVDTWLLWNLTGGPGNGKYLTDVTNASRTMLMNLDSLSWDVDLCRFFDIPKDILPEIRSSSEIYGKLSCTSLKGIPISGILGDQQAALVGQMCLKPGLAKNTYGTGCFLLYNTGSELVKSENGLLSTVAYKFGAKTPVCYALEGSVAIAGAAVQWLRDNLGVISTSSEIETLANSVDNTHGCYFVPAFSGLFCPYWQPDAKGIICGISQFTTKAHIARACLEAVCFQTRELLEAMNQDSGIPITSLQVDGGMTANSLVMQLQSDLVGIPVVRPSMPETTALGAAMAAGAAEGVNVWTFDANHSPKITTDTFHPAVTQTERDTRFEKWKDAVTRSMHWDAPVSSHVKSLNIWTSVPGGAYMMSTMGLLILANLLAK